MNRFCKHSLGTITLLLLFFQAWSQNYQVITNNNFQTNAGTTPQGHQRWCRTVFLITAAEMANAGITNGTQLNYLRFNQNVPANPPAAGTVNLYMENTTNVTYAKSLTWATAITGMQQVGVSIPLALPSTAGTYQINFTNAFTYTGGAVYLAMEYSNVSGGVSATTAHLVNTATAGLAARTQSTAATAPATMAATASRPDLALGFAFQNDVAVTNIYTLGKLPIVYGSPTTIRAMIRNTGFVTMTNINVGVNINGNNSFSDNAVIASLAPGVNQLVTFTPYTPTNLSTNDEVEVSITAAGDQDPSNNVLSWSMDVTQNVYSYKNPSVANTGGVGFNGGTGDFVAKFKSTPGPLPPYNNPPEINEIKVDLTTTGITYQLGIWDATGPGGTPGVNLWTSNNLVSSVGTQFIPVPNVAVPGDYFVGVRQTGTVNVGFAYQTENPIRSGTFYFTSPTGTNTWTDFAPNSPFRFSIEVQVRIPVPPNCAINPFPANGATLTCSNPVLSWGSGGGAPTGYNVYFGTNQLDVQNQVASTLVSSNQPGTTYTPAGLLPNVTYYWLVVPVNADGAAIGCAVSSFTTGNFNFCYCVPVFTGPACTAAITNVSVGSINNSSSCAPPQYTLYAPGAGTTTNLEQNSSYNLSVTTNDSSIISVWIDYNQNGILDSVGGEWTQVALSASPNTVSTVQITVPGTAVLGNTLMRVKTRLANNPNGAGDACTSFGSGEAEDYTVTIVAQPVCTGTPNPGNTLASASSVCPGASVNFSLQNITNGVGVTYQWFNLSGAVTGATNATYTQVINAYEEVYCEVSCSSSASTGASNLAVVNMNPFYNCYCSTNLHIANGPCIDEVIFNTLNNNTTAQGCLLPAYTAFPQSITTTVMQGVSYSLTRVTTQAAAWTGVWIDYNQSGTFDASEYTEISNTTNGALSNTQTIAIPSNASIGLTGMRVRQRTVNNTANDACLQFGSGETEDYVINIVAPPACSGTPNPGLTFATDTTVCMGQSITLSLQNAATLGSGITYQWYQGATLIPGATNSVYTFNVTGPGSYSCEVTCTNSSQTASSAPVNLVMNSFIDCYCPSQASFTIDEDIYNVTVNGASTNAAYANANNCTTQAPGPGSLLSQYANFKTLGSLTSLEQGSATATFEVRVNECDGPTYFSNGVGIWIDWNQDGDFNDAGENIFTEATTSAATALSPAGDKVVTGTVIVPIGAVLGNTVMRVICAEGFSGASLTPCLNYGYGETEDYIITVIPSSNCSGTPNPGNTLASPSSAVCLGTTLNLSLQNNTTGAGVSYQWQDANGPIAGATNMTYSTTVTGPNTYSCLVSCSFSGQSNTSNAVTITINPFSACYCPAGSQTNGCVSGDEFISAVVFNTINNASACPVSNNYSDFTAISTNVNTGATYTISVTNPNFFTGDQASVWFDWNQDGNLSDATEQVVLTGGSATTPFTGSVTVPANAVSGATRMRVRVNFTGVMSSCGFPTWGEVEDYTVVVAPSNTTLNLTMYIQGYWDGVSAMQPVLSNQGASNPVTDCDTITVELHDGTNPSVISYTTTAVLQTNGTAACVFPAVVNGNYYIAVKHRNAIETWSANPVSFSGTTAYNFTTSNTQAWGDNQIEIATGIWAFYSGDVVKDLAESTDLLDLSQMEFEINNFSFGYFAEDLTGDGNVDLNDSPILETNILNFVSSMHP